MPIAGSISAPPCSNSLATKPGAKGSRPPLFSGTCATSIAVSAHSTWLMFCSAPCMSGLTASFSITSTVSPDCFPRAAFIY